MKKIKALPDRAFRHLLYTLMGLGLTLTLLHLAYVIYAYQHCSIIYFIGEELWG